jgi:hypothetical protein
VGAVRTAVYVVAIAVPLVLAAAASGAVRDRYCSPTGDYCTSAVRSGGAVKLRLGTFSFFGRYRLCVKPAGRASTCKSFPLRRSRGMWVSAVTWYRNFPNRGARRYTVTWHYGGVRLGPPLTFAIS